jgi:hypothetical protein
MYNNMRPVLFKYILNFFIDTYELIMPRPLPPSHSGKIFKIHYRLVVGIQMKDPKYKTSLRPLVFDIPFRLFNWIPTSKEP